MQLGGMVANNYLQFSCAINNLTDKELEWCTETLSKLAEETDYSESKADFEWSIEREELGERGTNRSLWMSAEEYGNVEHVANFAQSFLKEFRPEESFSFTWAETCSKMRVDEFSGGGVFVTAEEQKWFVPNDLMVTAHNNWVTDREMRDGL